MEGIDLSLIQNCYVGNTAAQAIYYEDTLIWPTGHNYANDYLTFEALEPTSFIFYRNDLQYSLDNGTTWTTLTAGTNSPTINTNEKIMWKQTGLLPLPQHPYGIGVFTSTGNFNVYGNIMSLIYGDDYRYKYDLNNLNHIFHYLFYHNIKLIDASNLILPATTLTGYCYDSMFEGCISLTASPQLPATTLTTTCYSCMFKGCTSLTVSPQLPATTLAYGCYNEMFSGCTSLTTAPELSATTLVDWCYAAMFAGCTSLNYIKCLATDISATLCTDDWIYSVAATGTFVKAASADWSNKTGNDGIPTGWTQIAQ